MKMPQITLVMGLCIACIVLFFVGRMTAPHDVTDTRVIDSLTIDNVKKGVRLKEKTDSMRILKAYGLKYYELSLLPPKEKIISRTVFNNEKIRNSNATDPELDSIIVSRYRK